MPMEDGTKCICVIGGAILGIGVILIVILVPMSFSGVEYYEFGFERRKSTGKVDTDKVFTGGKHMIGPDFEFKIFRADAHFVSLDPISVFTFDKLEIDIDVYYQYFLRKDDLAILHKNYDLNYHSVMRKTAIAAIKAETPKYNTRQFITERKKVEAALFKVVREALGGQCCAVDCRSWEFACPDTCMLFLLCDAETDKGLWVDVKYFQLGRVKITGDVEERFQRQLILDEELLLEELSQDAQVERKETEQLVRDINNKAVEIRESAKAEAQMMKTISQANYTATVEKARTSGLKALYKRLNINDQEIKNKFDYLRTLRGLDGVHFTVDFQQRIVGGFMGSKP